MPVCALGCNSQYLEKNIKNALTLIPWMVLLSLILTKLGKFSPGNVIISSKYPPHCTSSILDTIFVPMVHAHSDLSPLKYQPMFAKLWKSGSGSSSIILMVIFNTFQRICVLWQGLNPSSYCKLCLPSCSERHCFYPVCYCIETMCTNVHHMETIMQRAWVTDLCYKDHSSISSLYLNPQGYFQITL